MPQRHALGRALVEHRIIGRAQRIGVVLQRKFKLARSVFADRTLERNADRIGGGPEVAQKAARLLHFAQAINLVLRRPIARQRRARQLYAPCAGAACIDQIIFQFARHHGHEAIRCKAVDDPLQHVARVEIVGLAVKFVHGERNLRDVGAQPGRGRQPPGDRLGDAVGVAIFPDEACGLHVLAGDIVDQDRARQEPPLLVHGHYLMAAQALAARDTCHVGENDFEELNVRVGVKKRFALFGVGNGHGACLWTICNTRRNTIHSPRSSAKIRLPSQ